MKNKQKDMMVKVTVELSIPVSQADAKHDGDGGKSFAVDIVKCLEVTIGGVPVKVRLLGR